MKIDNDYSEMNEDKRQSVIYLYLQNLENSLKLENNTREHDYWLECYTKFISNSIL
jgi:hypothetical protein